MHNMGYAGHPGLDASLRLKQVWWRGRETNGLGRKYEHVQCARPLIARYIDITSFQPSAILDPDPQLFAPTLEEPLEVVPNPIWRVIDSAERRLWPSDENADTSGLLLDGICTV